MLNSFSEVSQMERGHPGGLKSFQEVVLKLVGQLGNTAQPVIGLGFQ